jgi:phosphate:Na+ symporter
MANLRAAAALLVTGDERAARLLATEKDFFRTLEADTMSAHFGRLRSGKGQGPEASALHLDAVRDLTRVNAHIVAAAAYPVLETRGALLPSRLR